MRTVQVARAGGPEVLRMVDAPVPDPGPGEVLVDVAAAGVNFVDTYHRRGLYPRPLPFVLGAEAAGTVAAVGDGVASWQVGDRVVTSAARGAYADMTLAAADDLLAVPTGVDLETAAAVTLQGLTAHYLVRDTHPLVAGERALIHAGAGGVGGLLIQMAKIIGAEVFTTVSSPAKAKLAEAAGADHVIDYRRDDFAEAVRRITGEDRPLDVVYDGVGATTFGQGLTLLRPRRTMVLFGQSSGPVPPVDLQVLARNGSLFVTRPTLGDYLGDESAERARELFGWVLDGMIRVRIGVTFPLADAAEAHHALEGRRTTGKVLLLP